jgi:cell division septation protein DedD
MGYPRGFQTQFAQEQLRGWGVDTGYDWEHSQCRISFDNNDYSDTTPMAIYRSGDVVHLSHPAKNHVADTCTNPFIPSRSLKLKMSRQPRVDTFDVEVLMLGEGHRDGQIDHAGYQNCYNFCEDQDRSHCITSWRLPVVEEPGRYSFNWVWEFNSGQFYSTCFDAMILTSNNQTASPTIAPSPTPFSSTPATPTESPMTPTESPSTKPSATPTESPTPSPSATPTPSPSPAMITSDAEQLRSIFGETLRSIRFVIEGAVNATIRAVR